MVEKGPTLVVCMHAKLLQSCPTLCDPINCSPPGSSLHEILQAGTLEWVAMPPGDLPDPWIEPVSLTSPCVGRWFLYTSTTWEAPTLITLYNL